MKKPWIIRHVAQEGPTCTIAALAMIRGVSFVEVDMHIEHPSEMTLMKCADYLGDHGYGVIIKESLYHVHPRFGRGELTTPFAPAHILHVKQYADQTVQHVVVMDGRGRLYDPARAPKVNVSLNDFYMVTGVLGIWRPQDL